MAYAIHAINASTSIGLICNGATPIAIASATKPSIRPTLLRFDRLPVAGVVKRDDRVGDAHGKNGMITMHELPIKKYLLKIAQSG